MRNDRQPQLHLGRIQQVLRTDRRRRKDHLRAVDVKRRDADIACVGVVFQVIYAARQNGQYELCLRAAIHIQRFNV